MALYVGLDVHMQTCHATVVDEHGNILKQEKFRNGPGELEQFFYDDFSLLASKPIILPHTF